MKDIVKKYPGLNPLPPPFAGEFAPVAVVVEEMCIACDRCPPICFFDAIVMEDRTRHKYGRTAVIIEPNCTGCGLCFEACPVDAIKWRADKSGRPYLEKKDSHAVEDTDL
jgi:formate hydrogenlyase subunit 6/NADH:ubiquinone oxidoreductase subunit I